MTLPTRAEFIRDQLAGIHHGRHTARAQADAIGGTFALGAQGFEVYGPSFVPTDTGVMHGPALVTLDGRPTNCRHGFVAHSCAACADRPMVGQRTFSPEHATTARLNRIEHPERAGDCISVCASCGARVHVPSEAGHPPVLHHAADCPRDAWPVRDATRYDDDTAATVLNWTQR